MNESQNQVDSVNRVLRLHELIDESKQLEQKIEQQTVEESLKTITKIVNDADHIISESTAEERVANTTEAVLDSVLLKYSHELVTKVFDQATAFNDNMLVKAILNIITQNNETEENWDELANLVCRFGKTAYTTPSLLGYIDLKPKERTQKERQQRKKSSQGLEQRPETADQLVRDDKGSEAVKHVLQQLEQIFKANGRQPVPYYKLIVDPNNFNNTVQNSFQLSFLVRENVLNIDQGSDGYPTVHLVSSTDRKTAGESTQAICNLSMDLCRRMIAHYDIRKPMITWSSYEMLEENAAAEDSDASSD